MGRGPAADALTVIRRLPARLAIAAGVAALASGTALAAAGHARHLTGVVRSVNARRDTVRIALGAAANGRGASGPRTITLRVAATELSGPHPAIAIGDRVAVIAVSARGESPTATSVRVLSGSGSGSGSSVVPTPAPGRVTGTVTDVGGDNLSITVKGTPIEVIVTPETSLDVADINGDGVSDLPDFQIGDTVLVAASDIDARPLFAGRIVDETHPGPDDSS
jgi:hypothetical protein